MKKNLCKIISIMLIMSMLLIEMHFTSFGVNVFSYIKKGNYIKNDNYYQLLENNEEQIEDNTSSSEEISEQENDKSEQESNKRNNQENDQEDNQNIEPSENTSSVGEKDEPEEKPEQEGNIGQGEEQQDSQQEDKDNSQQDIEQTDNIDNNDEQISSEENQINTTIEFSNEGSSEQSEQNFANQINNEKIENEEKIATESEIENAGVNFDDLDKVDDTSTKSEAEEEITISTESETNMVEEYYLATISETIATDSEISVSTISALEQYILLDTLDMINMFGGKATKENETIILNADIKTKYPIIFNENTTLDLNGHDIIQEGKGYAIIVTNKKYYVENEEVILDSIIDEENKTQVSLNITDNSINQVIDIHAIIMKDLTDKETIYVDNASLNLNNVKIHAAETQNCISLNNSHFSIQNSYVFGGNGNATQINGGAGIYAILDNNSYNINLVSGSIRGGNGIAANNGNMIRTKKALMSSLMGMNVDNHTFEGKPNDEGCGVGGNAIYIDNDDYDLNKVSFGKNMVISSGDGGKRIRLRAAIFGLGNDEDDSYATTLSKYCLAKTGKETEGGNGTNLSMVSALKDQGSTNLCNVFSYTASAETYLMKHYRTYVNTMIAEDSSNLDFSEEALAFGLYHFISDPLGIAPDITNVDMGSWTYKSAGTNPNQLNVSLTSLRGIALEKVAPWKGSNNLYNDGDIDLSYDNKVAHLYEDKSTYLNQYTTRQAFVNDMKKKIYDGGVVFAGYFSKYDPSIPAGKTVYEYQDIASQTYIKNNYGFLTNIGDVFTFYNTEMPTNGFGGHAMYMVGWDDNFPKDLYPVSCRPANDGAFIVKNSWNQWNFVPYEILMDGQAEFHHLRWFPAYSQFENVYHYDSSYGQLVTSDETTIEKGCINYQVKKDNERLQAVSLMIEMGSATEQDCNLKLYSINSLTAMCLNQGTLLNTKTVKIHGGLNYFDVSDWGRVFNAGDCFSIMFENLGNVQIRLLMDQDVSKVVATYSTKYNHRLYYYYKRQDKDNWLSNEGYMIRMKVYTNNRYDLTMDADGGQFSNSQGTKTQAIYLTDKVNIDNLEKPQKTNKYFNGWYITKTGGQREAIFGTYQVKERADLTIKASWSDMEYYKAIFNVDGTTGVHPNLADVTSIPETQNILINNKVATPTIVPIAPGYVFEAWYKEPQCIKAWDFNTDFITQETILYAKWRAITYNINFDLKGIQATTPSSITKIYGINVTLPKPTNIQVGKKFVAWYRESSLLNRYTGEYDLATIDGDNKTLYAKWEDGYEQHTIYFSSNGGKGYMEPQVVNEGVEIELKANEFTKQGYGFYRWSSSDGGYLNNKAKISSVTTDLHLTANWQKNTGGGGNGGGSGGGSVNLDNNKQNTAQDPVRSEANKIVKKEIEDFALARGVTLEVIANKPIVQQFIAMETTALEYKKTVESILIQYNQMEGAKKDVFTPANQTAQKAKRAETKLTNYEFTKNQATGKMQLIDKTSNKAVTNCWQEVELQDKTTKWYKIDAQGNLETGIIVDGNKIYLLEEMNQNNYGAMIVGNYNIGLLSLQFNQDGALNTMNYNEILLPQVLNMVIATAMVS